MITRIAQISDTHLSPSKPYFRDNALLALDDIARLAPDIVIHTGDLALDGADRAEDLAEAMSLLRSAGRDTLVLPGNHDVGDNPDVARSQPATEERLARYRAAAGSDFWSRDIPGWRLAGLNALIIGSGLSGDDDQMAMLAETVAGRAGRALAIFLHKPVADLDYSESAASNRFLTPGARSALFRALGGVTPDLFCCGHIHQYRDSTIGGSRHLWAPATSFFIGDPWQTSFGSKAIGYLLHEFGSDGSHAHRLVAPRGLGHHDLVNFPDAYGDVRRWGKGLA